MNLTASCCYEQPLWACEQTDWVTQGREAAMVCDQERPLCPFVPTQVWQQMDKETQRREAAMACDQVMPPQTGVAVMQIAVECLVTLAAGHQQQLEWRHQIAQTQCEV